MAPSWAQLKLLTVISIYHFKQLEISIHMLARFNIAENFLPELIDIDLNADALRLHTS